MAKKPWWKFGSGGNEPKPEKNKPPREQEIVVSDPYIIGGVNVTLESDASFYEFKISTANGTAEERAAVLERIDKELRKKKRIFSGVMSGNDIMYINDRAGVKTQDEYSRLVTYEDIKAIMQDLAREKPTAKDIKYQENVEMAGHTERLEAKREQRARQEVAGFVLKAIDYFQNKGTPLSEEDQSGLWDEFTQLQLERNQPKQGPANPGSSRS